MAQLIQQISSILGWVLMGCNILYELIRQIQIMGKQEVFLEFLHKKVGKGLVRWELMVSGIMNQL